MTSMRLKPIRDLPTTPCPVCQYGHSGPKAIAEHNLKVASYGERSYAAALRGLVQRVTLDESVCRASAK